MMIDLVKLHSTIAGAKPLAEFARSRPFMLASRFLRDLGHPPSEIAQRQPGSRHVPPVFKVHPLIAFEYIRLASYPTYCARVMSMLKQD